MSDIINFVILGTIQGVTEWLPISSSGHLVLFEHILGIKESLAFDVLLHAASLLVILIFFWKDIVKLCTIGFRKKASVERQWLWFLVLSFGITSGIALALEEAVLFSRQSQIMLSLAYFFTTLILMLTFNKGGQRNLTLNMVIIISLFQGLAVIPGISRSGVTIGMALILGLKAKDAFRFSFLMAIPVMAAAFAYQFNDISWNNMYIMGFLATIFIGLATLRLLQKILRRDNLYYFSIYTFIIAMILLIV